MNRFKYLLPVSLVLACAACQPSTPAPPAQPPAPIAQASASPSPSVAPSQNAASPEPTPDFIPSVVTHSGTTPTDIAFEPLPEILLPPGVGFDRENSDEDNLKIYEAVKAPRGINFVYGEGTRKLVVFADPTSMFDLAFFQTLEENADNLDATITLLPYAPVDQPDAQAKVAALFCAQSPQRAWRSWMLAARANTVSMFQAQGRIPEAAWQGWSRKEMAAESPCSPQDAARLAQIKSMGDRLAVSFSPTMVFANGEAWPGPIISREELEKVWWYVHGHLKIKG